ncbi:MAG TPA: precorrin-6A synthase (deacetylating) [Ilumatobacteraceae bacterium]
MQQPVATKVFVIGIGAGDPQHLTLQAIAAMNAVDVFFVIDKGREKDDLTELRRSLCRAHITNGAYRFVELVDPPRDRTPHDYGAAVRTWHEERSHLYESAMRAALAGGRTGGFLVWGDPSLYDSTLRILEQISSRGDTAFDVHVIPGVTSVQALTARHGITLNRIGEPVHITTGRRLAAGEGPAVDTVVMLDGECAFTTLDPDGIEIFWGAYLGTPDEILLAGSLRDVGPKIVRVRAEARARHGWIMDIYLLRRSAAE